MLNDYTMAANTVGLAVLLIGAGAGCYRTRRWPSAVQLLGAACFAAAVLIGFVLPPGQPDPRAYRIDPGPWRAQMLLATGGWLTFAVGYAAEQFRGRKTARDPADGTG